MFAKPYKHKSNNTLKNSEKKHLTQRVQDEFPLASEEKVKELVPVKSSCICMKVVLHSGDIVHVYAVDGLPMFVETPEGLVPTLCALWKFPDLVPTLDIHTPVLSKIQGGAPLYLPGVARAGGGAAFGRGALVAARTGDNAAACLLGRAALASQDMLLRASGVCLETLHFYGDQLCKDSKFNKIDRPKLAPPKTSECTENLAADLRQISIQPVQEQWPALGRARPAPAAPAPAPAPAPPAAAHEPRIIQVEDTPEQMDVTDADDDDAEDAEAGQEEAVPADMDGLLRWSLLTFLKLGLLGRAVPLPLKTNLLYKNYLQPLCPPDRMLDVKKSSYKKFSKFLEAMQTEGLVEVRETEKGVSAVVCAAGAAHPRLRAHPAPRAARRRLLPPPPPPPRGDHYTPPQVQEMLCVTAAVHELFAPHRKGTPLTPAEVRTGVNEYVKMKNLVSAQEKGAVTLDPLLAKIVGQPEQARVPWEQVAAGVRARMTPATEMRFPDGSRTLSKARLAPVTMHVAMRSGNKKVTLVSNLEAFGFRLAALAAESQAGAAASAGVTRAPGAAADQLMLQGDQTHFIAKLLIEKYGLPKKFLEGADKALNKKK